MDITSFRQDLLEWYQTHQRDLPWRRHHDPYCIWISEIMLQQTQVETVKPYFERFISRYPTVKELAHADLEEVYKYWEGLGYYQRAKHLWQTAQMIVDQYQGEFPTTYEALLQLKGIGPYTASAIASIAFQIPKGVVDGNVLRIYSRLYALEDNIALSSTRNKIQTLVDSTLDPQDPSSFNQGLMDLGAMICRPRDPLCDTCPLQIHCQAKARNLAASLPINIKKINTKEIHYMCAILEYQGKYLLVQNDQRLLEHLYGFVQYEVESLHSFCEAFYQDFHENIILDSYIQDVRHVFSHRIWKMHVYHGTFLQEPQLSLRSLEEIADIPVSTAHKKVLQAYLKYVG